MLTEVAELLHPYAEVHHACPADAGTWDSARTWRRIFASCSRGRISGSVAGLCRAWSSRAAEIGCDQVEGRAVRAD